MVKNCIINFILVITLPWNLPGRLSYVICIAAAFKIEQDPWGLSSQAVFLITRSLRHLFSLFPYPAVDDYSEKCFSQTHRSSPLLICSAMQSVQRCLARRISLLHAHRNRSHSCLHLSESEALIQQETPTFLALAEHLNMPL